MRGGAVQIWGIAPGNAGVSPVIRVAAQRSPKTHPQFEPPCERGASEIIAYPPGIAGVSPAPRLADKIGREARQISWIHPICRTCHLPKLKCGIIPLCIGQAKPTPVLKISCDGPSIKVFRQKSSNARLGRLPPTPASVNAKERFISYSSRRGGGGKADIADIFPKRLVELRSYRGAVAHS